MMKCFFSCPQKRLAAVLSVVVLLVSGGSAAPVFSSVVFQSGPRAATFLELYTSEGCSSCPPADRWFSALKDHPGLWKEIIPVALHVDYWDYIGWKDPFADPAFTRRQRRYGSQWGLRSIYTPMVVQSGREFREWYQQADPALGASPEAGVLRAESLGGNEFLVTFSPASSTINRWEIHGALLGFGVESRVLRGENRGKILRHDFTALSYEMAEVSLQEGTVRATIFLKTPPGIVTERQAVAFWVHPANHPAPLQATGGYLN